MPQYPVTIYRKLIEYSSARIFIEAPDAASAATEALRQANDEQVEFSVDDYDNEPDCDSCDVFDPADVRRERGAILSAGSEEGVTA